MSIRFGLLALALIPVAVGCFSGDDGGASGGEQEIRGRAGKAAEAGDACGSRGLAACAEGLSCLYSEEAQCGAADKPGKCFDSRAVLCYPEGDPVCGCDGKTYPNTCMATAAGQSVRSKGPCGTAATAGKAGDACGSRGLPECGDGLACIFDRAAACGATDKPGRCVDNKAIRCSSEEEPVCGCDGKTYANECRATVSGASVKSAGACK